MEQISTNETHDDSMLRESCTSRLQLFFSELRCCAMNNTNSLIRSVVVNFVHAGVTLVLLLSISIAASAATGKDSKLCRESAANKWLLDYVMAHGNPSYEQKLEAIRQVSEWSGLVRRTCGDNSINNEILQSAKRGSWPMWIDTEVKALLEQAGLSR